MCLWYLLSFSPWVLFPLHTPQWFCKCMVLFISFLFPTGWVVFLWWALFFLLCRCSLSQCFIDIKKRCCYVGRWGRRGEPVYRNVGSGNRHHQPFSNFYINCLVLQQIYDIFNITDPQNTLKIITFKMSSFKKNPSPFKYKCRKQTRKA